jgi:hypothetical protein
LIHNDQLINKQIFNYKIKLNLPQEHFKIFLALISNMDFAQTKVEKIEELLRCYEEYGKSMVPL